MSSMLKIIEEKHERRKNCVHDYEEVYSCDDDHRFLFRYCKKCGLIVTGRL